MDLRRELDYIDLAVEARLRLFGDDRLVVPQPFGACYLGIVGMYPTLMKVPDINAGVHFIRAWNLLCSMMGGRNPNYRIDPWVKVTTPLHWTEVTPGKPQLGWAGNRTQAHASEAVWSVLTRDPPGLSTDNAKALIRGVVAGDTDP